MSKRCKLQSEYFKENGNYKGVGKYSDRYVEWLENKIIDLPKTQTIEKNKTVLSDLFNECKNVQEFINVVAENFELK